MKLLKTLKSLFSKSSSTKPAEQRLEKDSRGIRDIFESQIPSPKISDEIALFRISIPDTCAEPLTAEHLKKVGEIQGLTTDEALFFLDMMSVCHTGNPLFTYQQVAITYTANPNGKALNIIRLAPELEVSEKAPSEHFFAMLSRLKKTLDVSKGWGISKLKTTLAEFLPEQGEITALEVATHLRQSQRKLLNTHVENNQSITSLLDNADHMVNECVFPSGFVYHNANGLDETLAGFAMASFYKSPNSGGFAGLNGCIAAPDFISAIHSNRNLYSFSNLYSINEGAVWVTSGLSKILSPETPEKSPISGEGSKRVLALIERSKQGAAIYSKVSAHRYKFDLIEKWASLSKELPIKKQVMRLFGLSGAQSGVVCPLTAVENKRLALHATWVKSRAELA